MSLLANESILNDWSIGELKLKLRPEIPAKFRRNPLRVLVFEMVDPADDTSVLEDNEISLHDANVTDGCVLHDLMRRVV